LDERVRRWRQGLIEEREDWLQNLLLQFIATNFVFDRAPLELVAGNTLSVT
jgi:hypothetical protein